MPPRPRRWSGGSVRWVLAHRGQTTSIYPPFNVASTAWISAASGGLVARYFW